MHSLPAPAMPTLLLFKTQLHLPESFLVMHSALPLLPLTGVLFTIAPIFYKYFMHVLGHLLAKTWHRYLLCEAEDIFRAKGIVLSPFLSCGIG